TALAIRGELTTTQRDNYSLPLASSPISGISYQEAFTIARVGNILTPTITATYVPLPIIVIDQPMAGHAYTNRMPSPRSKGGVFLWLIFTNMRFYPIYWFEMDLVLSVNTGTTFYWQIMHNGSDLVSKLVRMGISMYSTGTTQTFADRKFYTRRPAGFFVLALTNRWPKIGKAVTRISIV